nr:hypothetical protein BaRGS_009298 [Batillaria attramentaria]
MSVSLLNTKDFKNSDVLDLALKNIVFNLLNEKNNIIIFMSGVGNPAFIRFDQSTSLQTQASNPVLQILSPGTLTNATLLDASVLNQSLFSMHNVHDFVKSLVQNEAGVIPSEGDFGSGINEDHPDGDISKSVCNALGVQPPFLCLCQDENVRYENDTLTVGFADFLVGLVNTQLRHSNLAVGGGSAVSAHSTCAKLYGASFTNVRVGHHKEKKRIFMDLALMAEGFEDRLYRHAVLEIRDMDKLPRSEVHFLRGGHSMNPQGGVTRTALNFNESDILLKTLCNTERNLNSRATSDGALLKELSQRKHFGRKPTVIHVHDNCLYMFVRDFGDSVSVDAGNMCRDRHYDVMLHLSLMNMMALTPLPISAGLGHAQTEFLTVLVKVSYTVPTFAYKLHPDFTVTYD